MGELLPAEVAAAMRKAENVLGRYILLEQIGKGGMGAVFKAWQIDLKRYVAVKFLLESDIDAIKRFYREAHSAAKLNHPYIAQVFEVGVKGGKHFLVMEYIEGTTLDKLIRARKTSLNTLVKYIRDAALGLNHAHLNGIVHRDVKPSNIMVTPKGRVYVMDFGLARAVRGDTRITQTGMVVGTPSYMAPEQAEGDVRSVDRYADIWSLGATLYEAITGRPPFTGKSAMETLLRVVKDDPVAPSKFAPTVSKDLEAIVLKCLEKDKRNRYPSAKHFADDLQRFLAGEPTRVKPPTAPQKLFKLVRRRYPYVIGAAVVLILATFWLVGMVRSTVEIQDLRKNVEVLFKKGKWAEALAAGKELEKRGAADERVREIIQVCDKKVAEIQSSNESINRRHKAMPSYNLGQEKLKEARGISKNSSMGIKATKASYREAIRKFEEALRIAPEMTEATYQLAEAHNDLRDDTGLRYADMLVQRNPDDPMAYLLRAKLRLWEFLKETAFVSEILVRKAEYNAEEVYKLISSDLHIAVEKGVSDFNLDLAQALTRFFEHKFTEAWEIFQKGLAKNPEDRDLLFLAGACALLANKTKRGSVPDPLIICERAYRQQPNDLMSLALYAAQLGYRSDAQKALEILDAALSKAEEPIERAVLVGIKTSILRGLGRTSEALSFVKTHLSLHGFLYAYVIVAADPSEIPALAHKAKSANPACAFWIDWYSARSSSAADPAGAMRTLDRLLDEKFYSRLILRDHLRSQLLADKAECFGRMGKLFDAMEAARAAVEAFPSGNAYRVCALVLEQLDKFQEALDYARKGKEYTDPVTERQLSQALDQIIERLQKRIKR